MMARGVTQYYVVAIGAVVAMSLAFVVWRRNSTADRKETKKPPLTKANAAQDSACVGDRPTKVVPKEPVNLAEPLPGKKSGVSSAEDPKISVVAAPSNGKASDVIPCEDSENLEAIHELAKRLDAEEDERLAAELASLASAGVSNPIDVDEEHTHLISGGGASPTAKPLDEETIAKLEAERLALLEPDTLTAEDSAVKSVCVAEKSNMAELVVMEQISLAETKAEGDVKADACAIAKELGGKGEGGGGKEYLRAGNVDLGLSSTEEAVETEPVATKKIEEDTPAPSSEPMALPAECETLVPCIEEVPSAEEGVPAGDKNMLVDGEEPSDPDKKPAATEEGSKTLSKKVESREGSVPPAMEGAPAANASGASAAAEEAVSPSSPMEEVDGGVANAGDDPAAAEETVSPSPPMEENEGGVANAGDDLAAAEETVSPSPPMEEVDGGVANAGDDPAAAEEAVSPSPPMKENEGAAAPAEQPVSPRMNSGSGGEAKACNGDSSSHGNNAKTAKEETAAPPHTAVSKETAAPSEEGGERPAEVALPLRPGVKNCSFYMRFGSCKFGAACKFNHPIDWSGAAKPLSTAAKPPNKAEAGGTAGRGRRRKTRKGARNKRRGDNKTGSGKKAPGNGGKT